jgi:sugar/nucleoside kinase (ribokinase family)
MHEKRFDIVVVGELNPDLILSGDVTPSFGQVEKLISGATLTIGSSSGIFACGAARLGLRVAFIGKVGQDEFGRFMLRALQEHGIDTLGVVIDPKIQTGLSVILSKGNDRAILTFLGSIPSLRFSEVREELVAQARHLHLGGYFMLDSLRPDVPALFSLTHQYGLTISLDSNYDPQEVWDGGLMEALKQVDIFFPNAVECCSIAHSHIIEEAMQKLASISRILVVKLGTQGALLRKDDLLLQAESIPVTVADTVGAGDSFDAGFLYGYLSGWGLDRTLRLATICGALSTRQAGGTTAQPTLEEALSLL